MQLNQWKQDIHVGAITPPQIGALFPTPFPTGPILSAGAPCCTQVWDQRQTTPPFSKSYLYERWKDVQPASAAPAHTINSPQMVVTWKIVVGVLYCNEMTQHPNKRDSEDCRVGVAQEMTPTKQYTEERQLGTNVALERQLVSDVS